MMSNRWTMKKTQRCSSHHVLVNEALTTSVGAIELTVWPLQTKPYIHPFNLHISHHFKSTDAPRCASYGIIRCGGSFRGEFLSTKWCSASSPLLWVMRNSQNQTINKWFKYRDHVIFRVLGDGASPNNPKIIWSHKMDHSQMINETVPQGVLMTA